MKSCLFFFLVLLLSFGQFSHAQCYFQQRVNYRIDADFDSSKHQITGKEYLTYTNNSPDTLKQIFFHLYWNAFKSGSMMDVRSQVLGGKLVNGKPNWDGRVKDRIAKLKKGQDGGCYISHISIDGMKHEVKDRETIAQILLKKGIAPNASVKIEIDFVSTIPIQIRRSGRFNAENVQYSISQWYPKICAYDMDGWHPTPYVAREFYGEWGDFEVNIQLDKNFVMAATGVEGNKPSSDFLLPRNKSKKIVTHVAKNVHDFMWAADPTYIKKSKYIGTNGEIEVFVYYKQTTPENAKKWESLLTMAGVVYPFIKKNFGEYPYPVYKFIQGGDGGMEYPMATLIKDATVGTAIHEWMHSWYQMMLGTNESLYAWMDEGFATWAEIEVENFLSPKSDADKLSYYKSYFFVVTNNINEPATKHADHFNTNTSYTVSSYIKGAMFLEQLEYIIGKPAFQKTMIDYYNKWRFKHPRPNDFLEIAEEASGLQLDWFLNYWIGTTETINYGVDSINKKEVTLRRIGNMPMPVDIEVTYTDGKKQIYQIPLDLMFGTKTVDATEGNYLFLPEWKWTHPTYTFTFSRPVKSVSIDPSKRLADTDMSDNVYSATFSPTPSSPNTKATPKTTPKSKK